MPSSLTRVLSRAWVSSTRLPVSVCGTVGSHLARGFSGRPSNLVRVGSNPSASPTAIPGAERICLSSRTPAGPGLPTPGERSTERVPPLLITAGAGHGISTVQPSVTPFGFTLGPTNLQRTNLPEEPLGFRRTGFSPVFSLLIPAFSLPLRPPLLTVRLHSNAERSPTRAATG